MRERISVDSVTMDYIQYLYFELNGLELILRNIILKNKEYNSYYYDEELLKHYIKEVKECSTKFNLVKNNVVEEYAPQWSNKEVIFDFIECDIRLKEGCGSCE